MTVKLKVKSAKAQRKMGRVNRRLRQVPKRAHKYFVKETPIDTGNARRNTRLVKGDTIDANYPYAVPLDSGSSRQAPQGMVLPTLLFIKKFVKRIFILG